MDLINLAAEYGPWSWIVGGLILLAIELLAPGGVFVWFGAAAVVTGLASFALPMDWPVQWAVFGVLSVVGLAGWLAMRGRRPAQSDSPFLNRRSARLVGQQGFLSEPLEGGSGRMELGDTVWRVTGPNLPVGHRVRVVGHKGPILEVESAEAEEGRVETA